VKGVLAAILGDSKDGVGKLNRAFLKTTIALRVQLDMVVLRIGWRTLGGTKTVTGRVKEEARNAEEEKNAPGFDG
jgi:hypothetical protein